MQLSAVILARVLLFVETIDLSPRGNSYFPEIVKGLVEKCGFMKFPEKLEEFDETKGVEFIGGRWGDVTIETLKVFNTGLQLDTRASTADSERILGEALAWASGQFGLQYNSRMVSRKAYVSDLTFYSDAPLLGGSYSPISKLMQRTNNAVGDVIGDSTPWQPTVLTLNSEPLPRKPLHAPFTIQRRAENAFSDNKYFSEAPLPTDVHIRLLEEFEQDVLAVALRP